MAHYSGMAPVRLHLLLAVSVASALPAAAAAGEPPHDRATALLLARCVECHGPDAQESRLRLDSRAGLLAGGEFGPAIVPG